MIIRDLGKDALLYSISLIFEILVASSTCLARTRLSSKTHHCRCLCSQKRVICLEKVGQERGGVGNATCKIAQLELALLSLSLSLCQGAISCRSTLMLHQKVMTLTPLPNPSFLFIGTQSAKILDSSRYHAHPKAERPCATTIGASSLGYASHQAICSSSQHCTTEPVARRFRSLINAAISPFNQQAPDGAQYATFFTI